MLERRLVPSVITVHVCETSVSGNWTFSLHKTRANLPIRHSLLKCWTFPMNFVSHYRTRDFPTLGSTPAVQKTCLGESRLRVMSLFCRCSCSPYLVLPNSLVCLQNDKRVRNRQPRSKGPQHRFNISPTKSENVAPTIPKAGVLLYFGIGLFCCGWLSND